MFEPFLTFDSNECEHRVVHHVFFEVVMCLDPFSSIEFSYFARNSLMKHWSTPFGKRQLKDSQCLKDSFVVYFTFSSMLLVCRKLGDLGDKSGIGRND